ncbi:MAG: creatininase family protein [Dehalococcoidia bacterium]|nr:creatininase family protein [Dehalococcoidia bacterium]
MGYSIFDETMVDMTWPEVEKAAEEGAIVLLPTGVIEEHGPHMGLGVDAYISYLVCRLIRRELEATGIKTLIAPPYYWGINQCTGAFPGSFTVRKETIKAVLHDILASLKRWGFTYVFNINWHGDQEHNLAILEAINEAGIDTGIRAYCILEDSLVTRLGLTGKEDYVIIQKSPFPPEPPPKYLQIHAESTETSIMLHYFPDQVDAELARTLKSTDLTFDDLMVWRQGWSDARKVTPLGYFGDPASFDLQAGKRLIEGYVQNVASLIESFIRGNYQPPEIK